MQTIQETREALEIALRNRRLREAAEIVVRDSDRFDSNAPHSFLVSEMLGFMCQAYNDDALETLTEVEERLVEHAQKVKDANGVRFDGWTAAEIADEAFAMLMKDRTIELLEAADNRVRAIPEEALEGLFIS